MPSDAEPGASYDSAADTKEHIDRVRFHLETIIGRLADRGLVHDASKLDDPEKAAFDEYTPKLKGTTYGSEQYKGYLAELKVALDHHYAANSHHPEHYRWHCPVCGIQIDDAQWEVAPQGPNDSGIRYCPRCCRSGMIYESELMDRPDHGVSGMTLIDLVEMLADWKAATERHADGDLARSIQVNRERFHLDPQLASILENTRVALGW